MKKSIFIVFLIVLCVCTSAYMYLKKQDRIKYLPTAELKANHLRKVIQKEIDSLGNHEWAGEYYYGDGLGVNVSLLLAPQSGFLFEWHGCLGLYDRNYGDVIVKNGIISLSFTYPNTQKGFQGIADTFIPVSWGERKYLIPTKNMVQFCNDVNSGSEPRQSMYGMHLLKSGDNKKRVTGDPQLPEEFRKYLLKSPIIAEIIEIGPITLKSGAGDWKFKETPIALNVGKQSGLLSGMELYIIEPDNLTDSVTVGDVYNDHSKGTLTQFDKDALEPQVGWKLSTVPRWSMHTSENIEKEKEEAK